ncbi:MAG TPA: hypothetical protein VFD94_12170, partial [Jatrophihabitans sp.]|nr:hypothetical protein [Jatrophihabitans sp.]
MRTDDHGDAVALEPAWTAPHDHPLAGEHRQLVAVPSRSGSHLIAFDAAGAGTVYDVTADGSAVVATNRSVDLAAAWDLVEPFQIGARNHLMAYSAERGQFGFFPLAGDLSLRKPYLLARARGADATTGYTMTQPIVVNGLVYLMCYDFDSG